MLNVYWIVCLPISTTLVCEPAKTKRRTSWGAPWDGSFYFSWEPVSLWAPCWPWRFRLPFHHPPSHTTCIRSVKCLVVSQIDKYYTASLNTSSQKGGVLWHLHPWHHKRCMQACGQVSGKQASLQSLHFQKSFIAISSKHHVKGCWHVSVHEVIKPGGCIDLVMKVKASNRQDKKSEKTYHLITPHLHERQISIFFLESSLCIPLHGVRQKARRVTRLIWRATRLIWIESRPQTFSTQPCRQFLVSSVQHIWGIALWNILVSFSSPWSSCWCGDIVTTISNRLSLITTRQVEIRAAQNHCKRLAILEEAWSRCMLSAWLRGKLDALGQMGGETVCRQCL